MVGRKQLLFITLACLAIPACSENHSDGPSLAMCSATTDCPGNLVCITAEGVCKRPVSAGDSCASSDATCTDGECIDGICVSNGSPVETGCSQTSPCVNGKICLNGKCLKQVNIGDACNTDVVCSIGECVDGTCTKLMAPGQACDPENPGHACITGFECNDNVCKKPVLIGGDCSSSVTFCANDDSICRNGVCVSRSNTPTSCENDTDNDGIPDTWDRCDVDTDNDGKVDCLDEDSDNDGIPDRVEALMNECGEPADTTQNGVYDFLSSDSDGNGIPDSVEGIDADGNIIDTDNNGIPDSSSFDNDGDGIPDAVEITGIALAGYDEYGKYAPRAADCNGDGLPDEPGSLAHPFDCDGDTIPDYNDADSDGDGIADIIEFTYDANKDGYLNRYSKDSDGDGLSDAEESGCPAEWSCADESEPNLTAEGWMCGDTRANRTLNTKCRLKTSGSSTLYDYENFDLDGDGLWDGREVTCPQPDGSALLSRYLPDVDNDGFGDLAEYNAAIAAGLDPASVICDPKIGVTQAEGCTDCKGLFDFYFELPYEQTYDPAKEKTSNLLFVPAVSKLDVVFNLDTTSSMGDEVNNIKNKVRDTIIPGIRERVTDSAFGVSHFDDFPTRAAYASIYDYTHYSVIEGAYGRADGKDTPFELLGRPETTVKYNADGSIQIGTDGKAVFDDAKMELVQTNVNKLTLHHGADLPESGFESLWQLVKGDDKTQAPVLWHPYGGTKYAAYFSNDRINYTDCKDSTRWGGACFRQSTLPVVVHITDTTSHDGNQCDKYTENKDFKLSSCTVSGSTKSYIQPYDPIYVENAHNSDDVVAAYNAKGARIISIFRGVEDSEKGKQLAQLVQTSEATNAFVPVCAFQKEDLSWTCGDNKCCTTTDKNGNVTGVAPNAENNCVLSYGISSGDKLSDTLVNGVDAMVKYAATNVAAVIRGEAIEGYEVDTSCFITAVEALDDGYIAPPLEPEKSCNPTAKASAFNDSTYKNGYTNFAIGTSSTARPGAKLNFRVKAENNCVKETEKTQVFNAYIDIVDPNSGLVFGSRQVSIVVPGVVESNHVIIY